MTPEKIAHIARIVHEANRAYCQTLGDDSQSPWEEAAEWQKSSIISGVKFALANPDVTPEQMHENWLRDKEADGWGFGPVKDATLKEHPCMVPYHALPAAQQIKDRLCRAIIGAFIAAEAAAQEG